MKAPGKSADQWFAEYGESHRDHTNETIHWICVPAIFFSVLGLLWGLPVPAPVAAAAPWFRWAQPAIVAALLFYLRLSAPLACGLFAFIAVCSLLLEGQRRFCPFPVWQSSLLVFVVAWIGQFIGHRIEGKKPSFFKDLVFLLIGPAWLLHFVYRRWRIHY